MIKPGLLNSIIFSIILLLSYQTIYCQSDEAREASGLPTFIGSRPGSNAASGGKGSLSGTLMIQGVTDEETAPTFTVIVLANGGLVSRQTVRNRAGFIFNGIPESGVTLVVEADNIEVARYPLQQLNPAPLSNRQDIVLTWLQINKTVQRRNEVISLINSYKRSESNQKNFEKAIQEKKKENSIKLFTEILENDSADFVVWTEMGNVYFTSEKFSEAENAYNKALSLKTDFLPALVNLGKLYLNQKANEKAIETFTKALTSDSASADINHYLGEAYLQAKKGSKAVIYLNEALKLEPVGKAEIHLRLATLYNAAGAKDRAVAEYKMFLEKVPNHPEKKTLEKYIKENSQK